MFGLSQEHSSAHWKGVCPFCGKFIFRVRYFNPDGSRVKALSGFPWMDKDAYAECPQCGSQWYVFEKGVKSARSLDAAKQWSLPRIGEILAERFNLDELQQLCFDLDINYESLEGGTIQAKARELVLSCKRNGILDKLVTWIRSSRPDVSL